ncbi:MAG: glycosyltransferase family 4 protein [Chitinophagales bacterium]|nr:glycosyltransferase family 4 protein [Chitinophagales bacterium]HMX61397.1 glycosyltransferase family 4 protein [Chitinophagales bacterium]HMZ34939.1 glycosyltransferase family 4 protein [Chitinophagales bacterium]HNB50021.1 glycosyltransferase family 4 protein [Chitinophagales bacterium]HNF52541.1 glycosyltransferase family 4 protein [Chitinophagales bacterium]
MQRKITYILFGIDKAPAFEWIIDNIDAQRFQLEFILISGNQHTHIESHCVQQKITYHVISYRSKKDIPRCVFQVYSVLRKTKPDAVHAHIFEGGLIGITAAFLARVPKRIYTRHYSSYHHQFHPNGIKYDRIINKLSTHIIAICNNVKNILVQWENVPEAKITLIRHGFDLNDFYHVDEARIAAVQHKYNPKKLAPIIGVVSRFTYWKGIQYTIPAFKTILQKYPNAHLVLANANGDYKKEILALLSELPETSYTTIKFENDNAALFKLFDVFVHVPIDQHVEAFGQIYVEALATSTPSVFTLSGVSPEFITNEENALVVDFKNSQEIANAVLRILDDDSLRQHLKQNAKNQLDNYFSLNLMIKNLEQLYEQ